MSKIVRFHKLGGPENLRFEDAPTPQPAPGEVRLRVTASGLNRAESLYYHGQYFEEPRLPSRLGYEVAGIVEAVGEGVDRSWLEKTVGTVPGFSQNRYGTLGEEAVVPVGVLAISPPNLTPAQAAAVWMAYLTAYGALVRLGQVTGGDFVSITAASSSVGLAAIQLTRDAGATPIAVTRTAAKRAELLALGADHVVVTQDEDYVARVSDITGGRGARLTFDPVGGSFAEKLVAASAAGGTVFEYGLLSGEPTPFPLREALRRGVGMRGYSLVEIVSDPALLETAKTYVYDRLTDGRFVPKVAKTFSFAQSIEAYRYLESNQQVGKVVITVP